MTDSLVVEVGAIAFSVGDDGLAAFWNRVSRGDWEPATFTVLDHLVWPGSTFVDIGAWVGPVTLYAASIAGRCLAFEPDPVARAALMRNLRLNPALSDRVEVRSEAVGPRRGQARLGNITSRRGGDSMSSLLFDDGPVGWTVDTVTLADVLSGVDRDDLSLVKIDIEGAEVDMLSGSADYIARWKPPLYLSVHSRFWPEPLPVVSVLSELLGSYDRLLSPDLTEVDPRCLFDDEHLHGLYEIVAV